MPVIVPPAGIGVVLITVLLARSYPGMGSMIALGLVLMMFGAMLIFVQVALAIETMSVAFRSLKIVP